MTVSTRRHYLDYNATCPVLPAVVDAVCETMRMIGNSSSVHGEGRAARAIVEDAREKIRALINAPVNGVIFTSGGTEAIHYAVNGLAALGRVDRFVVSAIEHAAVHACARATAKPVTQVPVTPDGVIDLAALADCVAGQADEKFLVCLMLANNETGAIQPVREAADIVHEKGGLLFVDAAQAAGKIPVNFVMSGADLMSVTAHKFGGPAGIGALVTAPNLALEPVMRGGGHESNRRAGTHNVPGIAGFGVASAAAPALIEAAGKTAARRDRMQAAALAAGATVWAQTVDRLPGTLSLSAAGFDSQTQLMAMDLAGIAISSGSACSSGKTKPSHVLAAMGASDDLARSGARISIGWATSDDDVEVFCREWPAAYARVRKRVA